MNENISNELRDAIYNHNVKAGWWDEPVRPDGTTIALIHSEITEAWTGLRTDMQDEHLPQYMSVVVELADAAIRIYDFFGHKKWNLEAALNTVYRMRANQYIPPYEMVNFGYWFADLHAHVSYALEGVRKDLRMQASEANDEQMDVAAFELAIVLDMIYKGCARWNWPLVEALGDKRAYNANRADHKRENRAAEHGKKF